MVKGTTSNMKPSKFYIRASGANREAVKKALTASGYSEGRNVYLPYSFNALFVDVDEKLYFECQANAMI